MNLRAVVLTVAVAALAAVVAPGRADAAPDAIVIECHAGARPDDADRILGPIRAELSQNGFLADPEAIGSAFESGHSLPGLGVLSSVLDGYEDFVDEAFGKYVKLQYAAALKQTATAIEVVPRAGQAFASRPERRRAYRRALVAAAFSELRSGNNDLAAELMAELVRSFPDMEVSRDDFGPEVHTFYKKVKESLRKGGTGARVVKVDSDAVIFVNERYVGLGEVRLDDLPPGRYRVLVQKGAGATATGRTFFVDVDAGKDSRLDVNWTFTEAVRTSPLFSGCQFDDATTRDRLLSSFVPWFASAVGASRVVVLSVDSDLKNRRRYVSGTLFTEPVRTATIAISPVEPSDEHLRSLGAYLAGATDSPPPTDPAGAIVSAAAPDPDGDAWAPSWVPWTGLATGVAAVAGGAYLVSIDGEGTCGDDVVCPRLWDTKGLGIGLIVGGVLAAGASTFLYLHDRKSSEPSRVAVSIGSDTFAIGWQGAFGGP